MAVDEDLKARLKDHSKAFEGLMALVPADYYYGKDNSDQWQRKKQTKEERRAAKKAKLEPGAYKTALDVHKEREQKEQDRKRKRDVDDNEGREIAMPAIEPSGTGSKRIKTDGMQDVKSSNKNKKKRKSTETAEEDEQIRLEKAQKRRQKNRELKQRKKDKVEKKRERRKAKHGGDEQPKQDQSISVASGHSSQKTHLSAEPEDSSQTVNFNDTNKIVRTRTKTQAQQSNPESDRKSASGIDVVDAENEKKHSAAILEDDFDSFSAGSSPEHENPFDTSNNHSSTSSSSSVVPPSDPPDLEADLKPSSSNVARDPAPLKDSDSKVTTGDDIKNDNDEPEDETFNAKVDIPDAPNEDTTPLGPKLQDTAAQSSEPATSDGEPQLPKIDRHMLTQRLADKLAALRAARNADGPDGKPARNRAELIEARRRKAELRKQQKKEQRAKERESRDAETEAARLRGGNGSPIWSPSLYSPGGALAYQDEPNFHFGKVAFEDGVEADAGAGFLKDSKKKKGKSDPKTALLAAEKKKARLAGYDAEKRADIEEKDAWAAARNRVAGEKGRDDSNLLKKTLKRKEKAKGKTEKEWADRMEGVKKGQEMRQQKREDNLRKRKELKGVKGKDRKNLLAKQKSGGVQKPKQRKRPGFEGTFKTAARST